MDLVDRYLHAVRFWLPKAQKEDIISELSEDLRSQIEEREAALGHALGEIEVETLLKQRGSPFTVAGSFLPQRHLVGPQLYPIYEFVLKLAGAIYLIPSLLVWAGLVIFVPGYRAAHPGGALFETLGGLWTTALTMFAMITLGFAVGERFQRQSAVRQDWNPRRLPAYRNVLKVPRASSLAEIVMSVFILIWWLGGFNFPVILSHNGSSVSLPPSQIWIDFRTRFFVPISVFILAGMALALADLIRPNLTPLRVGVRAIIDAATPVMIFSVLGAHAAEIRIAWDNMTGGGADKLVAVRDWGVAVTLGIIGIGCFISCVRDVLRIARWNTLRARDGIKAQ